MITIIVGSTALVQSSGIQSNTTFAQFGGAAGGTTSLSIEGFDAITHLVTPGPFSNNNIVSQFEGAEQVGNLIVSSGIEVGSAIQLAIYFPDFSRGVNLFGVIGTEQTVARFFDRSPFFFSPHETDPNTLRDISEAQQFLIFSQVNINSYDNFRSTSSPTQIIAVKGEAADSLIFPTNLVSNGSFENSFTNWTTSSGHVSDVRQVRTDQPTGVGFNDGSPISPPDGSHWAYVAKTNTTGVTYLYQTIDIGTSTGVFSTDNLLNFSFQAAFNALATSHLFQANLIFFNDGVVKRNLIYRILILFSFHL